MNRIPPRRPTTTPTGTLRYPWGPTLVAIVILVNSCADPTARYDLIIANGRVIDPASQTDGVRHLGVKDGTIVAVSDAPLAGTTVIDAAGLVVSPGFIDLHAHGQDNENYRVQALDGVTTALELELGTEDVEGWYAQREGTSPIHYGVAVGHARVRMLVMGDSGATFPRGVAAQREASDDELNAIKHGIAQGLEEGALGVGFGLQYTPGASEWEVLELFRLAATYSAPAFVHQRYMSDVHPGSVAGLEEIIAASVLTGTPVHKFHVHSSGLRATPQLLSLLADAQRRGVDISTEAYPYSAGSTALESAIFDPGWRSLLGIDYNDLEWPATGERLTATSFATYRKQGGWVIIHFIPDDIVEEAIASPLTIISSDGRLRNGRGHPRTAGTFARVLGRYVRETQTLTLMDAIGKMTLMPARRLARRVPQMRSKGRISIGADADLTVFDPTTVIDRSTYQNPTLSSEGIEYVLVAGTIVVDDGALVEGATPGQPMRAR